MAWNVLKLCKTDIWQHKFWYHADNMNTKKNNFNSCWIKIIEQDVKFKIIFKTNTGKNLKLEDTHKETLKRFNLNKMVRSLQVNKQTFPFILGKIGNFD